MINETANKLNKDEVKSILDRYTKKSSRFRRHDPAARSNNETMNDPASKAILQNLGSHVAYFLEGFPERMEKYEGKLKALIAERNPSDATDGDASELLLSGTLMKSSKTKKKGAAAGEQKKKAEWEDPADVNNVPKVRHPTVLLMRDKYTDDYIDEVIAEAEAVDGVLKYGRESLLPPRKLDGGAVRAACSPMYVPPGSKRNRSPETKLTKESLEKHDAANNTKAVEEGGDKSKKDGKEKKDGEGSDDDEESEEVDSSESSCLDIATDCSDPPDAEKTFLPCNKRLLSHVADLRKECYELTTVVQCIEDYVIMMIPAEGEEGVMGERKVEALAYIASDLDVKVKLVSTLCSFESQYLNRRASLEKSLAKFPYITTYAQSIILHDQQAWVALINANKSLIRCNVMIYSVLSKNFDALLGQNYGVSEMASSSMYQ